MKELTLVVTSVRTVLIFQFNPGFGAEESVPAVLRYRCWYLGFYFSIPGFRYKVFMGLLKFF